MIRIELEPKTAAQLMTLISIAVGQLSPVLSADFKRRIKEVMLALGKDLEPFHIPVGPTMAEMFPTAEILSDAEMRQKMAGMSQPAGSKETIQ